MKIFDALETSRLSIRKFKITDKDGLIEFMLNENSTKYLNFTPEQKTVDGVNGILNWVLSSYETDNPILSFALESKNTNSYVGSIGLSPYGGTNEFECYYSINEKFLRQCLAKESMAALLRYAFNIGVSKVFAFSHPDNLPSEKLALSLGMRFEDIVGREDLPKPANCFSISSNK